MIKKINYFVCISPIFSQLKYFLLIMGADTKVSELDKECLYEYVQMRKEIKNAELVTLRHEKSTINNQESNPKPNNTSVSSSNPKYTDTSPSTRL